jgi:hypothetical protein
MDVIDGLSWEYLLNDDEIDVAVKSGIFTLTGTVDSDSKNSLLKKQLGELLMWVKLKIT